MTPKSDPKKGALKAAGVPRGSPEKMAGRNPQRPDPQRPGDGASVAPNERRPEPPATEQWREHEHQAPAADLRAAQLLQETGSPELAKHAVDQAEAPADEPIHAPDVAEQDAAAREFGYDSFAALVKDAVSFPVDRGPGLMVCELIDGRWIRFDRESWPKHEIFRSREEAMKPVAPG
jgi:hypothetical protein